MATIHIQTGKNVTDYCRKNSKVQSVPFKIDADCDAKVSQYFDTYVRTNDEGVLEGSFRGYPLRGKEIKIPDGYVGLVLHETVKPPNEGDERNIHVVNHFTDITLWNWDKTPGANDTLTKALDWIKIAEALHSPLTEEELSQ